MAWSGKEYQKYLSNEGKEDRRYALQIKPNSKIKKLSTALPLFFAKKNNGKMYVSPDYKIALKYHYYYNPN